jgi:hypothetical protein
MGRVKRKNSDPIASTSAAKVPATTLPLTLTPVSFDMQDLFPLPADLQGFLSQNSSHSTTPRWKQIDFYLGPEAHTVDRTMWIRKYLNEYTQQYEVHWMRENIGRDGRTAGFPSRQRVSYMHWLEDC